MYTFYKIAIGVVVMALVAMHGWKTAQAHEPLGLFWGMRTKGIADVQRMKDTSNGAVCYVAVSLDGESRSYGGTNRSVSISCVKP